MGIAVFQREHKKFEVEIRVVGESSPEKIVRAIKDVIKDFLPKSDYWPKNWDGKMFVKVSVYHAFNPASINDIGGLLEKLGRDLGVEVQRAQGSGGQRTLFLTVFLATTPTKAATNFTQEVDCR